MNASRLFFTLLACLAVAAPVAAQNDWIWLDKEGRKVFSDRPPPADVTDKSILRQPGRLGPAAGSMRPVVAASAPASAAASAPALPAPRLSGKDKELEDKRRQAEQAELERKRAEEEKQAALRADNCKRAQANKAGLESGVRIARTNAKGEREFLDDKERATELKRLNDIVAAECK